MHFVFLRACPFTSVSCAVLRPTHVYMHVPCIDVLMHRVVEYTLSKEAQREQAQDLLYMPLGARVAAVINAWQLLCMGLW